jgi:Rod binding domain-containing protein
MDGIAGDAVRSAAVRSDDRTQRAVHAAREFEAVLLNALLGSLEQSFVGLPGGKKKDPASDSYQSMGIQALATSLASRGGIGIASRLVDSLLRPAGHGRGDPNGPPKVSSPSADQAGSGTLKRLGQTATDGARARG